MRTNENQRGVVSAVKEEMLSLDKLLALRPLLSYHVVARMSEIRIRRRSVQRRNVCRSRTQHSSLRERDNQMSDTL